MEDKQVNKKDLLLRQLKDIQKQADLILSGQNSASAIEQFSSYSEELKGYILKYVTQPEIVDRVKNIQKINFKKSSIRLWQLLTFSFWLVWLIQQRGKQRCIKEISLIKNQYSMIDFLLRSA